MGVTVNQDSTPEWRRLGAHVTANATPTLVGTTTDPTGINNLVVDGTTYDVTFSTTTLNSFAVGSTLSLDAQSALISALDTLKVTELGGLGNPPVSDVYNIDPDNTLSSFNAVECPAGCTAGSWGLFSSGNGSFGLNTTPVGSEYYLVAADFTAVPSSVPEPMTLGLFGTGLVALFILRRRVNRAVF